MPLVDIKRISEPHIIEQGDLVIIDGEPYLTSCVTEGRFKLISLTDGNRWGDDSLVLNTDVKALCSYIAEGEPAIIQIIKHNKYKIKIEEI